MLGGSRVVRTSLGGTFQCFPTVVILIVLLFDVIDQQLRYLGTLRQYQLLRLRYAIRVQLLNNKWAQIGCAIVVESLLLMVYWLFIHGFVLIRLAFESCFINNCLILCFLNINK